MTSDVTEDLGIIQKFCESYACRMQLPKTEMYLSDAWYQIEQGCADIIAIILLINNSK